MSEAAPRTRTRTRGIDLENRVSVTPVPPGTVTDRMHEEARRTYLEGVKANKAAGANKKARKELFTIMKDGGVSAFSTTVTLPEDGRTVPLTVEIGSPTGNAVNIAKLKDLVPMDVFLKIVSATQAAVEEHAGSAVLKQCLVSTVGEENVTVKAPK